MSSLLFLREFLRFRQIPPRCFQSAARLVDPDRLVEFELDAVPPAKSIPQICCSTRDLKHRDDTRKARMPDSANRMVLPIKSIFVFPKISNMPTPLIGC